MADEERVSIFYLFPRTFVYTTRMLSSNRIAFLRQLKEVGEKDVTTPHGVKLKLTPDVLAPHSFTFELIDIARDFISQHQNIQLVADAGTGSGVIGVTLATLFPKLHIFATDINKEAIAIAQHNAHQNNVASQVTFKLTKQADGWIHPLPQNCNLILSNPPYISDPEFFSPVSRSIYPEILLEPESAIRSYDDDGMSHYKNILTTNDLKTFKTTLLEINPSSHTQLRMLLKALSLNGEFLSGSDDKPHFLLVTGAEL